MNNSIDESLENENVPSVNDEPQTAEEVTQMEEALEAELQSSIDLDYNVHVSTEHRYKLVVGYASFSEELKASQPETGGFSDPVRAFVYKDGKPARHALTEIRGPDLPPAIEEFKKRYAQEGVKINKVPMKK